jgi:hypothetical protein
MNHTTVTKTYKQSAKKPKRPGPKPEVLKINGNWRDAVKLSLAKKKPHEGWLKQDSK